MTESPAIVPEQTEQPRETLWVTDAELIRRMGVPEKVAREALRELDRRPSGFPQKNKLWGDRRYWPAVRAYFDAQHKPTMAASPTRRDSHVR